MRNFLQILKLGWDDLKGSMRLPALGGGAKLPPDRAQAARRAERIGLALLLTVAALYAWATAADLSRAYVDLGDGNYLYTSARLADGLTIYRDFLSPQPPMHPLSGALLIRLGRGLGDPLMTVRVFSIVLRILTFGWIYLLGRRLTQTPYGGALAAAVFAILPLGWWWSRGFQSEPQEMFWLLGALVFFLAHRPTPMILAGAMTAFAVLTNMTAAPYALGCLVYLAVRRPRRLLPAFATPFFGVLLLVAGWYELRTGAYLENVVFNQVGSYPKDGLLAYALGKIGGQSAKILALEGGWIVLALLGLLRYNRTDAREEREFFVWYALILLLSILFVSKGGTMDYIFTIGEPAVALFAAYLLAAEFYPRAHRRLWNGSFRRDTSIIPQAAFALLLLAVLLWPGARFMNTVVHDAQFEQSEDAAQRVAYFIRRASRPDEPILAQPYYAFLAERRLALEYSELYLWTMKYRNERRESRMGPGREAVLRLADALKRREIPVVVAALGPVDPRSEDMEELMSRPGPLLLASPEIREALAETYAPVDHPEAAFETMSFRMRIFVPKD